MVAVGGSTAQGIRLATSRVGGPGRPALGWLALTLDVSDRSGAPAAAVIDEVGEALLAELARAGEREVALAASRATATLLALMPLAGAGLGAMIGVNVVAVLLGSAVGRLCLVVALALWGVGRWWARRLIARAERAGQ
jgi:tight adherence protein B